MHPRMTGPVLLFCLATIGAGTSGFPAPEEKLLVVATLPTLEALAQEVGGDRIETVSLAKGDQDPHFVSPTPVLMQKTRRADLFIEVGMSLELWAEAVVAGSGNPRIATGTPDPVRAKRMAANIERGLEARAPSGAEYFRARLKSFEERVDQSLYGKDLLKLVGARTLDRLCLEGRLQSFLDSNEVGGKKLRASAGGWLAVATPLRGAKALEYHKVWIYFARTFGLDLRGTIEERPGIPPGPQHLQATIKKIESEKIPLVLVDNFYDPQTPRRIAEEGGAQMVLLPNQVRGEPQITTYFELIDRLIREIAKPLSAKS